ncbi:MAG TPA: ATP-binding cassette domain-containing protein [Aliidongia sp.]|nr:ATP-binding cassette domain-containing protein [Aliidongia sp.]
MTLPDQPPAPVPLLSVDAVTLQYRVPGRLVTAVHDVSFTVLTGDRFVILGPSGCGKSSLLKAIAGFARPSAGAIRLDGVPVRQPGPDRMMVFQDLDQMLPWQTVAGNVVQALRRAAGVPRAEAEARAAEMIGRVGLAKFADAYPHTLSGGMKQRAALARALALRPAMLLMDEPFAALDALTRATMQRELLGLSLDMDLTVLFVTHSVEEALLLGTRILVLSAHPGQVRAEFQGLAPGAPPAAKERLRQRIETLIMAPDLAGAEVSHAG